MPWINLGQLLDILQSRRIDPSRLTVYLTGSDLARVRRRPSVNSLPDLGYSEPANDERADEEEEETTTAEKEAVAAEEEGEET